MRVLNPDPVDVIFDIGRFTQISLWKLKENFYKARLSVLKQKDVLDRISLNYGLSLLTSRISEKYSRIACGDYDDLSYESSRRSQRYKKKARDLISTSIKECLTSREDCDNLMQRMWEEEYSSFF